MREKEDARHKKAVEDYNRMMNPKPPKIPVRMQRPATKPEIQPQDLTVNLSRHLDEIKEMRKGIKKRQKEVKQIKRVIKELDVKMPPKFDMKM